MSSPFHVLEWRGEDTQADSEMCPGTFSITGFGRDSSGETTSVRFAHLPSFLIRSKVPDVDAKARLLRVLDVARDALGVCLHETSGVVLGKP
jgi:hypothetical protein